MKVKSMVCIAAVLAIAVPVWAAELPPVCSDPVRLADAKIRNTCEQLAKNEEALAANNRELAKIETLLEATAAIVRVQGLLVEAEDALFNEAAGTLNSDHPTSRQLLAQAEATIGLASRSIGRLDQASAHTQ